MSGELSARLGAAEAAVVQEYAGRLGLGRLRQVRRLGAGRSGAAVWAAVQAVPGADRRIVLKVTTAPERLGRAATERRVLTAGRGHPDAVMPELVAGGQGEDWVAVALECGMPVPPPTDLSPSMWRRLAASLATLHGRVADGATTPSVRALLDALPPEPRPEPDAPDMLDALDPLDEDRLRPWIDLRAGADLQLARHRLGQVAPAALPTVVEHGDCHSENAVIDPTGAVRWVDWQEARRGDGSADLVFLWQRAEFAGGRPPRAVMTRTYAHGRGLTPEDVQPLLDRAELVSLVQSWPPFLGYGDSAARDRMRARLHRLVHTAEW